MGSSAGRALGPVGSGRPPSGRGLSGLRQVRLLALHAGLAVSIVALASHLIVGGHLPVNVNGGLLLHSGRRALLGL